MPKKVESQKMDIEIPRCGESMLTMLCGGRGIILHRQAPRHPTHTKVLFDRKQIKVSYILDTGQVGQGAQKEA